MKKTKILLVICLMVVVSVASIAGTIAWLTDQTTPVVNTFTPTNIDIDLKETQESDGDVVEAGVTNWTAELVPGKTYPKNPKVKVIHPTTDVDVYLFVKVEETNNNEEILLFDLTLDDNDSGWTQGDGDVIPSNVWYRTVSASAVETEWNLLNAKSETEFRDGYVTINSDLTKEQMPTAEKSPKLTFAAYAIQTEGSTGAADAWTKLNPTSSENGDTQG